MSLQGLHPDPGVALHSIAQLPGQLNLIDGILIGGGLADDEDMVQSSPEGLKLRVDTKDFFDLRFVEEGEGLGHPKSKSNSGAKKSAGLLGENSDN